MINSLLNAKFAMPQGAIMGTKVDLDGDYEMITKLGLDPPTSAGHVYEQGALRKRRARRQPAIWPLFIALAVSASVAFLLLKCAFHLQVNLSRSSRALSSGDGGDAWKTLLSHVGLVEFFVQCECGAQTQTSALSQKLFCLYYPAPCYLAFQESCESSDDEASDTPRRRSPVSRWKLWTGRLTEGMASVYGGKRSYEPLRRVASTASSASAEGGATFASAEEGPSSASADRGASSASADRGASSASADRGASSASADRKASDVSAVVGHGGMGWVQHQTVLELGYPWAPHQLGFTLENPFIDIGGEVRSKGLSRSFTASGANGAYR